MIFPDRLFAFLSEGAPALVLSIDENGYAHTAMSWVVARDRSTIRFGGDIGSTTLANLEREQRASLQVIGPDNLIYLIKGPVEQIKARIEAAAFPIAMLQLRAVEVKDQAWPHVVRVTPLQYEWIGDTREEMASMEEAVLTELREWEAA